MGFMDGAFDYQSPYGDVSEEDQANARNRSTRESGLQALMQLMQPGGTISPISTALGGLLGQGGSYAPMLDQIAQEQVKRQNDERRFMLQEQAGARAQAGLDMQGQALEMRQGQYESQEQALIAKRQAEEQQKITQQESFNNIAGILEQDGADPMDIESARNVFNATGSVKDALAHFRQGNQDQLALDKESRLAANTDIDNQIAQENLNLSKAKFEDTKSAREKAEQGNINERQTAAFRNHGVSMITRHLKEDPTSAETYSGVLGIPAEEIAEAISEGGIDDLVYKYYDGQAYSVEAMPAHIIADMQELESDFLGYSSSQEAFGKDLSSLGDQTGQLTDEEIAGFKETAAAGPASKTAIRRWLTERKVDPKIIESIVGKLEDQ